MHRWKFKDDYMVNLELLLSGMINLDDLKEKQNF